MHKSIFFVLLFLAFFNTHAQTTQWVSTILEVSTEQTPREFSSEQIIGKPNVNPGTGESPNAWMPYKDDKEEYVKVGFKNTIKIRQIAIAESYNPGAVYQIYVYDRSGNEFLINTFEPGPIELTSRMLHVFFDLTEYEVSAVKIVFNCEAVPGFIGIDAIAISNSTVPIKQEVVILESEIVNVSPQRLSETVNTVYNELKPLITPDGKILLFSRQNHPGNFGGVDDPEDIWFSLWDEEKGEWQEAKNMGSPLNNSGPNYIGSITPDGNTVVITLGNKYKRNKKMTAGVSMSTRTSEGWSTPVPFKILNGTNFHKKSNYFMANNRKVMLMSIEGELSFGSRDIYVSFLIEDRKWSKPLNLGSQINTVMEEASPFLAADDKTLYFSTDGYTGYGKHDIFISRRLDDTWTNWSEPENLGSQINSPEEDAFFNIPPTGEYGYFNRNVADNNSDIFRFELPKVHQPEAVVTVKGVVYDSKTKRPVQARISYESLPNGIEIGTIDSDPLTGEYQIILPSGTMYGYFAEAEGYVAINENIDLTETEEFEELNMDLFIVPIEKGAVVKLNNIFFQFNESKLKVESYPELDRVIKIMNENKDMRISVEGHTDNIGTKEINLTFSTRRAKAVTNYLEKGGIARNRMRSKGWGMSRPVASNDKEKGGRELNRRVEMKILEE